VRTVARLDPLIVGVVSAGVYALHGFSGFLDRDLGVFTYGGEQVAHGLPPYVQNFNTVGPLADLGPGLAIWVGRLVGADPVHSERVLYWLLSAACCALVAVLGRDLTGSRAAGFVAAGAFLTFGDFLDLATNGPREKTLMVLLLLAALILLGRRRWAAAGLATALATLTWQPVLATAVAAAAVLLVVEPRRVRSAVRFAAGGLAGLGAAVVYFLAYHALHTAVEDFAVINARYVHQPSLFSAPATTWHILWRGYGASLLLVLAGLVLVLVAALARPRRPLVLATGAAALVGIVWTSMAINGAPDLFELLPFGALGLALAAHAIAQRAGTLGPVLLATACAAGVLGAAVEAVHTRNDLLRTQQADVAAVIDRLPPNVTVASIGAPEALALAHRSNPTPYQLLGDTTASYFDATRPGGMAGFIRQFARTRPTLLAVGRTGRRRFSSVLRQDYRRAGHAPGWTWYVARDAGVPAWEAVQTANLTAQQQPRLRADGA
jgi:hypothetical protein